MARDKSHSEQVKRWANFVKSKPIEIWKPALNDLINSQYEIALRFYKNLEKTKEGRETLERLKKERLKVRKRD